MSNSIKIKPFADITSKENINRDVLLQSEYNAEQYTRERHHIDIDAHGNYILKTQILWYKNVEVSDIII